LYGVDNVINAELDFFANSKKRIDTCMNYTRPSLAVILEQIKKAFLDAKGRRVKLRYLTEITHDNIAACKELMTIVDELRHLDGIKGNFMVSQTEYRAPVILFEKGKIASQIICSNVKEILDQHQYMFDTLWNKAISAQQRIREIEEGIVSYETKVLEEDEKKIKRFRGYLENSNQLSVCTQDNRLQFVYNNFFKVIEKIMAKSKNGEHKGIRWLTCIKDKDSANLARIFLSNEVIIRHINQIPISFGVSDKEVVGSIANTEGTEMAKTLFVSNEPLYVQHLNSLFEELWKNGIDAEDRIRDIEVGAEWADVEVIPMSSRAKDLYLSAIKNAQKEVMIIFPTTNAFIRQQEMGAVRLAKEASQQRKVKVRILMPKHESTEQMVSDLTEHQQLYSNYFIDIRHIEQAMLDTQATILVVDKKISLVMEIRDDSMPTFDDAIGLSTYSNSKAGVLSYVSIFENLWLQTELYQQIKESNTRLEIANERLAAANEQLKIHHTMQQQFINIAAHELRTPIQPILGLSQILHAKLGNTEYSDSLNIIVRNAIRLQRLTEDVLDVQKIDSQTLNLNKARFNLNDLISNLVQDYKNQLKKEAKRSVRLQVELPIANPIFIEADENRLTQVISNLLDNAVKFTKEGTISVRLEYVQKNNEVIVSIEDSGMGIDPEIFPRLFSKFAAKSDTGTGLGLFISKSIIEAHGGKIWAQNNNNNGKKGATFAFRLPLGC
jgi:signal transduction histidine kinase